MRTLSGRGIVEGIVDTQREGIVGMWGNRGHAPFYGGIVDTHRFMPLLSHQVIGCPLLSLLSLFPVPGSICCGSPALDGGYYKMFLLRHKVRPPDLVEFQMSRFRKRV
jgi:hypothetical protein